MNEFMKELSFILNDTAKEIEDLRKKYQFTDDEEVINSICSIYKKFLGSINTFDQDDSFEKMTNAEQGVVSSYIVTADPTIIQTKSGKKIVLSEDPIAIRTISGKKIVLDKDPIVSKKGCKIVLEDDPISIETRSGKKIILDEDPLKNKIKSNNISIIESKLNQLYTPSPWSSYEDNIAFITDSDPVVVELPKGKKIVLSEDPISIKDKKGKSIILDKDPVLTKSGIKKIVLNEDPKLIEVKSGKSIILDKDLIVKEKKGKKIVLDKDPISISIL